MRRIGISVGHVGEQDNPPAEHPDIGIKESFACLRVLRILQVMLDEYRDVETVIAPIDQSLVERIAYLNVAHEDAPIDIAIELHMNAFTDRNVDGCECLYLSTDATAQAWAEKIQEELVSELSAHDRGAKAFDNRSRNGFIRMTNCPAVIIEPLFISNDRRAQEIINSDAVHRIAIALFRALTT